MYDKRLGTSFLFGIVVFGVRDATGGSRSAAIWGEPRARPAITSARRKMGEIDFIRPWHTVFRDRGDDWHSCRLLKSEPVKAI